MQSASAIQMNLLVGEPLGQTGHAYYVLWEGIATNPMSRIRRHGEFEKCTKSLTSAIQINHTKGKLVSNLPLPSNGTLLLRALRTSPRNQVYLSSSITRGYNLS
jgi:hypothetical protein